MSDTHDHDKTTFVRAPGATAETPETPTESVSGHDQTFMMKPSARAREAAAALSAEREAKRSQTLPPPPPDRGPSLDTVDFDVTAGFDDEPAAVGDEFFDITQGADVPAADSHEAAPPPAVPASAPAPTPPPMAEAPAAPAAGGGGKLVLIAIIVAAVIAGGLWFAMR